MPLLRVEQALGDPAALAAWHAALSNLLAVWVPHDLLGLWLYPVEGGVVLLGPEALAQDELKVPLPAPQLEVRQLAVLEEIVRDAGYGSALTVPIRFGRRDVGLLLAADLHPGRYADAELHWLTAVARRLAPGMGRMARQWTETRGLARDRWQRIAGLVDAIADASAHASTSERFTAALSRALEPLLPHDRLELLVADADAQRHYRIGESSGGAMWADPSLVVGADVLTPSALADREGRILLADAVRDERWPRGYFTAAEPAGAELRAIVGAEFRAPDGTVGYLLAGSVGPDMYETEDAELLVRTGRLIAAHVSALARAVSAESVPARSAREDA
ncbi:MAG TPA: hypothetical protein VEB59_11815, partial [Gemmatimonadales bacterium]|nr:hypothetical protein [Gemmatimonadales bacterium]